jgi:hypothetical protein
MIITITNSNAENGRPNSIGSNSVSIANRSTYTFTVADFTTETRPPYSDPEDDSMSYIKILNRTGIGELQLNGVTLNNDDLVYTGDISTGNFTYVSQDNDDSYPVTFKFDCADEGSGTLSGLTDGIFTISVAEKENQPPDSVGNNTIDRNYSESITFTRSDFTTNTTPPYNDPEGDAAYKLKITSLPSDGLLTHNNSPVTLNQEILFNEIDQGYMVYTPDSVIIIAQTVTFDYCISDTVSQEYTCS